MAKVTGNTVPTTKTNGSIGDIYTDTSTGYQYKCTFACCSSNEEYYEWKKIGKEEKKPAKTEVKTEQAKPIASQESEKVEMQTVTTEKKNAAKTDYTSYSASNNKTK